MSRPSYFARIGGAISQLGNVVLFNGDENYSISTDAHRLGRVKLEKAVDKLLGEGHCKASYQHDLSQAGKLLAEAPIQPKE